MKPRANRCVICKKCFWGPGNNAEPVKTGQCCNWCNSIRVVPERMRRYYRNEVKS